jgi:hypothetical protein
VCERVQQTNLRRSARPMRSTGMGRLLLQTGCGRKAPEFWRHCSHVMSLCCSAAISMGRPALLASETAVLLPPRVFLGLSVNCAQDILSQTCSRTRKHLHYVPEVTTLRIAFWSAFCT